MRIIAVIFLDIFMALILFVGIQACRGIFDSFASIFSTNIWLSMSAKDVWIFLICFIISASSIKIRG